VKRALAPATNPTGIGSSAAAIYAGIVMIWNASHHHAVIDPQVIVAALGAAAFLYARFKVTPVADPKDGNGQPLVAAASPPVITVNATGGSAETGRQIVAAIKAYEGRSGGGWRGPSGAPASPKPDPAPTPAPAEKTLLPPAAPE
jgi:hypothetical protein